MYLWVFLCSAFSQMPAYPEFDQVWSSNFTETFISVPYGVNQVTGSWYYDATLNTSRMDRSSGRYDPFCGQNDWFLFFDTPCTHLVNNGKRYLIYPQLQICCMCCYDYNGCGILSPTWLTGSTFMGTYNISGQDVYVWNQGGTFYFETVDPDPLNRVMLALDERTDQKTFPYGRNNTVPSSVFNVPTYCSPNNLCDSSSLCGQIRNSGTAEYLEDLD